jgi:hypothetical protein
LVFKVTPQSWSNQGQRQLYFEGEIVKQNAGRLFHNRLALARRLFFAMTKPDTVALMLNLN